MMIAQETLNKVIPKRWNITDNSDPILAASNKYALERISENKVIQSFIYDDVRFKIVPVARRSFKTELAKRIIIHKALNNANKNYFFGYPTYGQAKRDSWEDLKNMIPYIMIEHISESDLMIKLKNKTEIWLIGFDAPQRFEGRLWHGGILDEFADFKRGIWEYHILPALSDTNGWCIFIGTPEGLNNDFYDLYDQILRDPIKHQDYKIYHWTRADVSDPSIVEYYKSIMPDQRAFRQEFLGEFVELSGRIYRSYDIDKHENKSNSINLDSNLPIAICMDFNKNCVYELAQIQGNMVNIFDEIYLQDTDITEMNNEIKARLLALCNGNELTAKRLTLNFYGDYTSEQRRDVSVPKLTGSSWKQIQLEFENNGWNFNRKTLHNPHVMDRINAVNFKLAKNEIIHSSKCQELKKDFLNIQYGSDPDKNRTHASDALGYMIHKEFPLGFKSLYSNIEAYL